MRYNFHEQLRAVKSNPHYVLPADINKPVVDFLKRIGCNIGVELVEAAQKNINYRTIELVRKDTPNAKLVIQIDCGMAEGYRQYVINTVDGWVSTAYDTIKNSNLDKTKPKKEGQK
jgi:hypothetical protein